jgi:hypothetical protein
MPNHQNLEPTLVNLFPQQLIIATTNILLKIDAPAFADPIGEFF